MALGKDRRELMTNVMYFMDEVAERGGIVVAATVASGAAMDSSLNLVTYASNPSGQTPLGILLADVVNKDLTREHENWYRLEVQKGGKVPLGQKGEWITDRIIGTPARDDFAFLSLSGYLIPVSPAAAMSQNTLLTPKVGKFLTKKDQNNMARVLVDL